MLLEDFLQFIAAMIGAQSEGRGAAGGCLADSRRSGSLVNKFEHRRDALFDLVPATEVNFVRAADGIADVVFVAFQRLVELAEQKSFFRRLRIEHRDGVNVAMSHA